MNKKGTILVVIPARGGSKGLKDKNILNLGGRPLIAWTLSEACKFKPEVEIVVSTDSERILSVAQEYGATNLNLRPANLAEDNTKTIEVLMYEIEQFEEETNNQVDFLVLLQPTSPFRTEQDIKSAIEIFVHNNRDRKSVISCYENQIAHPRINYKLEKDYLVPFVEEVGEPVRRQDFEKVFVRNGAIYIAARETIMGKKEIISEMPLLYEMPRSRSINIDSAEDLEYAQRMLEYKGTACLEF